MSASEALDRAARPSGRPTGCRRVAAAVVRDGEIVWSNAIGAADYEDGAEAKPNTQYRIGSITKTFTATAVMQLRAEGKLDLDDRLEQHLDGVANGSPTIRRLLCHLSGLQREAGEMFVTGESPTADELVDSMARSSSCSPPARAAPLLEPRVRAARPARRAQARAAVHGVVDERIIRPLGLERTTWQPQAPKAQGYLVDEYARTVWSEPETDLGGTAPAGQLWSTVEDLCRWATFLAAGHDDVLAADVVEEMWFPQVMYYPHDWVLGWGLGLQLHNQRGAIYGGHGGAMAGHLAGVFIDRKTKTGAAVADQLGHARRHGAVRDLARGEGRRAAAARRSSRGIPESEPPADARALLGRWWSEGNEFVFWWQDGTLHAKVVGTAPGRGETTFERDGDGWRAARGRERGERLRIDDGRLVWAGYAFTRAQEPFKA